MARERAPLVEPDPERPGWSRVTYVFPIGPDVGHVTVQPGFGPSRDNLMHRVAGTSVCHAAYRYRDDVRTSYSFGPDLPLVSWHDADEEEWRAFRAFALAARPEPDPNHREFHQSRAGEGRPDNIASILSLPGAAGQSVAAKRPGIARGPIDEHRFESTTLGNSRRVWIYTPPGYRADGRYPLLLAFDGGAALTLMPTHRLLDNLLADGRLPPMVAVLVDNATETSRNDELPCSEPFACFLETELVPWVRAGYAVSDAPEDGFVTGVSYGGLASLWIGLRLPHLFGAVISQSASLWWGPGIDMEKPLRAQAYAPEWLTERYASSPRLPLRIWMEIGLMEPLDNMIAPNRRMRDVLRSKGYDLVYRETPGGHDYALWRGTLATALETMVSPGRLAAAAAS